MPSKPRYIKTFSGILKVVELFLCITNIVVVIIFEGKNGIFEGLAAYAGIVFTSFILAMSAFRGQQTNILLLPFEIILYWTLTQGVQHAVHQSRGYLQTLLELLTAVVYLTDIIRTSVIHRTMLFIPITADKKRGQIVTKIPRKSVISAVSA